MLDLYLEQQPTVSESDLKTVVSSELIDAIRDIRTIIKSNTSTHPHHRTIRLKINNNELRRLNNLLEML